MTLPCPGGLAGQSCHSGVGHACDRGATVLYYSQRHVYGRRYRYAAVYEDRVAFVEP
jgi:hypothetical protein